MHTDKIRTFIDTVLGYYSTHARVFPWRVTKNPYHILVSEIMLQQTQAERIIPLYNRFVQLFPTPKDLADAPLSKVFSAWKGLGYNRRAQFLQRTAQIIVNTHNNKVPRDRDTLLTLPGIGPASAGDILAFAYNIPEIVIETNIRSVVIRHFFSRTRNNVHDDKIKEILASCLQDNRVSTNPRMWYSALMDYGAMIKQKYPKNKDYSRKSTTYKKQKTFTGSDRELRARILFYITESVVAQHTNAITDSTLQFARKQLKKDAKTYTKKYHTERVKKILTQLAKEHLIATKNNSVTGHVTWYIADNAEK